MSDVLFELRSKCIEIFMQNTAMLSDMEKNILLYILKKKYGARPLYREVIKSICKKIWVHGSFSLKEAWKLFGKDMEFDKFSASVIRSGFDTKGGQIVHCPLELKTKDKILTVLEERGESTIQDIVRFFEEREESISDRYLRAILGWSSSEGEICNVGKSKYDICDRVLEKYDVQKIADIVYKWMKEEDLCYSDTKNLISSVPGLSKIINNPYELKIVLLASGKFERGKKFVIKAKRKDCEGESGVSNKEIVRNIVLSSEKPLSLGDIVEKAKTEYGREIPKQSLPAVISSLNDEILRVEGGYVGKRKFRSRKIDGNRVLSLADTLFHIFNKGFFIDVLVDAMENEGAKNPDKFLIKDILKKHGIEVYGRNEVMTVAPKNSHEDPVHSLFKEYLRQYGKDVKKITEKIYTELGEGVKRESLEARVRNYLSAISDRTDS